MIKQDFSQYWACLTLDDARNSPKQYMRRTKLSSEIYNIFVTQKLPKNSKILEIGCNVGRNLEFLRQHGYKRLYGIDVSQTAINYSAEVYPELVKVADLRVGKAEDILALFGKETFGQVYTSAVLLHIDTAARNIILDWVAKHARRFLGVELEDGQRIVKTGTKAGALFNPIFLELELCKRGFDVTLHQPSRTLKRYMITSGRRK